MAPERKTRGKVSSSTVDPCAARRRRIGPRLLLLFGSTATALVLAEAAVRLIGRAPEVIPIGLSSDRHVYRRSANPILSYEFKPGFRSDEENLRFDYRVINSHGLRDVERQYAKPPGTRRVILLGDSVVVGYRIRQIDALMSRQLETLYAGRNVEVLNMAVTGYCTRAEVELLRVRGLKYRPDAVIVVFVENDFRNFNPESVGADGIADRPDAACWLFRRSHLFRMACLECNWFSFGLEADPARWNRHAIGENNVPEGLALLRRLADEHGFRPLVAVWPAFRHDGIEYPEKMFMPASRELIVERLARGCGVPVVGLREAFIEHWRRQTPCPNPRLHYSVGDEMHPSLAGHRAAAEILRHIIDEHRLLEPPEARTAQAADVSPDDDAARRAARALGTDQAGYGLSYINQAVALNKEGKLDDAIERLEKVSESDLLNYADASVMMASILARQGKTRRARLRLEKAIEVSPDHFFAHISLAMLCRHEQAFDKAVVCLRRAVELRPDSYDAQYLLGVTLAQCRRWRQAEPHLRTAVRLNRRSAAAAQELSRCLRNLRRRPGGPY